MKGEQTGTGRRPPRHSDTGQACGPQGSDGGAGIVQGQAGDMLPGRAMNGSETARSGCHGYALNVYPQDYTERRNCVAGSDDGGTAMMVGVAILPYRLSRHCVNQHPASSCQHHPPKGQLPALLLQITRPSSAPRNHRRVASMPSFMSWTDDSHQTGSCRSTK